VVQIFTCWRAFLSLDSHSDITDGNPKVLIQPGKITHFIHYSTPERRGVIDALSLSLCSDRYELSYVELAHADNGDFAKC